MRGAWVRTILGSSCSICCFRAGLTLFYQVQEWTSSWSETPQPMIYWRLQQLQEGNQSFLEWGLKQLKLLEISGASSPGQTSSTSSFHLLATVSRLDLINHLSGITVYFKLRNKNMCCMLLSREKCLLSLLENRKKFQLVILNIFHEKKMKDEAAATCEPACWQSWTFSLLRVFH